MKKTNIIHTIKSIIVIFLIFFIISCRKEFYNDISDNSISNGLSAPQQITAQTVSSTSVKISWTTVSGAYQYLIYRSVTSNGLPAPVDYTFDNYFFDNDLIPGEKYYYRVAAIDSEYNSGPSSKYVEATTDMPQAPSKPAAQGISSTQIKVSWTTVPGAVKYQIFRSVSAEGNYGTIPVAETEENNYFDSGLQPVSTYYYKITAVTKNGTISAKSDYISGTTLEAGTLELLPTAPENLTVTAESSSSVFLSWSPVAGAIHYVIYRSTIICGSPTGTTFTNSGLTANTVYSYSVATVNSAGEGPKSTAVSVTTKLATFIITFDSMGGSSVSSQTITSGKTVTKPTNPTKAGYDFVEWQKNGTTYNFATAVTSSFTLTAKWNPKTIASTTISGITMTADYNGYKVQWGAVSGAESYRIYKSNSKIGTFNYYGAVTGTSFEDKSLGIMQPGQSSFYQITAFRRDQGIADVESTRSPGRGVTTTSPILYDSSWRPGVDTIVLNGIEFGIPSSKKFEISPGTYSVIVKVPSVGIAQNKYGTHTFYVNTTYTLNYPNITSQINLPLQ